MPKAALVKVPTGTTCGHCGRKMNTFAGGSSRANNKPLCHPNVKGRPDCYSLVTVYKHNTPCNGKVCYEDHDNDLAYINSPESQTLFESLQELDFALERKLKKTRKKSAPTQR